MSSTKNYDLDIDTTLGGSGASDYIIPSQKAIKAYTDNSLASYQLIAPPINSLSTSGTITLTDNSINSITPSGNITFTLPTVTDNTVFHEIMVQINLSTVYTVDVGTTYYFNKTAPDLTSAGTYNLYYEYDKASQHWYCGALSKGIAS